MRLGRPVFIKLYLEIQKNRKIVQIKDGRQPKSNSPNYEEIKVRNKAVNNEICSQNINFHVVRFIKTNIPT